jgi:hypothetical protein
MDWEQVSIRLAEEKKTALRDRLAAIEREILHINDEIAKLDTYIDVQRSFELESSPAPPQPEVSKRPLDERFRHKSYKSAVELVLELGGHPMKVSDITNKLIEAGIDFVANDPERAVFSALSACVRDGYVRRTATGLWEIVPETERQSKPRMIKQINPREISEKTREALSRAKERGVKLGSRERITDDQRAVLLRMASEGETISAMAEAVGFSVPGMSKWLDRHGIRRIATRNRRGDDTNSSPTSSQQPSEQSAAVAPESERQPEPSPLSNHPREQTPEPESRAPRVDLSWRP